MRTRLVICGFGRQLIQLLCFFMILCKKRLKITFGSFFVPLFCCCCGNAAKGCSYFLLLLGKVLHKLGKAPDTVCFSYWPCDLPCSENDMFYLPVAFYKSHMQTTPQLTCKKDLPLPLNFTYFNSFKRKRAANYTDRRNSNSANRHSRKIFNAFILWQKKRWLKGKRHRFHIQFFSK